MAKYLKRTLKITIGVVLACGVALLPDYEGITPDMRRMMWIAILAAAMWVTEAVPAFAVSLLVMFLEVVLLGRPWQQDSPYDWLIFLQPWSSSVIWLFLGGLMLGEGAKFTKADVRFARYVLAGFGQTPQRFFGGVMLICFFLSMFMSNTATAVMMVAVVTPMFDRAGPDQSLAKALLIGIAVGCNLGGMGTIIGTPPNAIAVGLLPIGQKISFIEWMGLGLPPAILLAFALWLFLGKRYPLHHMRINLAPPEPHADTPVAGRSRIIVGGTFLATISLWLTGSLHGIPAGAVALLPLVTFTLTGIADTTMIRRLPWEVLLLIAGGLALGVGIIETGLARWLVNFIPSEAMGPLLLGTILSYLTAFFSNFVSNTAAANMLIPIGMAVPGSSAQFLVVAIALGASLALCLPISTPPNAIVYGTKLLTTKDLLIPGLCIGVLGPLLSSLWCFLILG